MVTLAEYVDSLLFLTGFMEDDEFETYALNILEGRGDAMLDDAPAYQHPGGCRLYLEGEVVPSLRRGLEALVAEIGADRLRVAAGRDWEADGPFRPPKWYPLNPMRWLADWLDDNNPNTRAAPPSSVYYPRSPRVRDEAEAEFAAMDL